ncbi:hypothetical protein Syun_031181 [Stephania yunnanensis]|uniref:Thioredoxin domain-containing protein n=1 Tax=Stephania yunnanensis TaxID=152371 RepID=A0AAP0HG85_9MAGN
MDSILRKTSLISPSLPPRLPCTSNSHTSSSSLKTPSLKSSLHSAFHGRSVSLVHPDKITPRKPTSGAFSAQMTLCIGKALKWWEKGVQPNMKEITSAQDLVDSLLNSGNRLAVVDFFSPGCGGCRALHPKIKKFKDALAKHSTERSSLGPPKGLEESELIALAANKDLSFNYTPKPVEVEPIPSTTTSPSPPSLLPSTPIKEPIKTSDNKCTLLSHAGR